MRSGAPLERSHTVDGIDVSILFDEASRVHPDRIAVSENSESYSYNQLRQEVHNISSALLAIGCRPQTRVCLAVSHGMKLVASVLAILKIGATYVPIDTRSPFERIKYIVADSGSRIIAHTSDNEKLVSNIDAIKLCVDATIPDCAATEISKVLSSDLAYILYTSGSTGKPKGVGITHGNLLNYVSWAKAKYIRSADDRIALYTTLAFDFTVTCIFPPLIAGASIGIYDGVADPMVIRHVIDDESVNIIKITPSYLHVLSQLLGGQRHIRRLIVGGEDLKVSLAARIHRQMGNAVEIINEYGPTEATVGCLFHTFDPGADTGASVPIGVPIPGMHAYIFDENGSLIEDDREGELYISGKSVARGYINLEERSRAAFIDSQFQPGTVMYRTGDVVKKDNAGKLHFVGRKDDQVKIRGNRVELSEISAAILDLPMVTSAYVTTLHEHGSNTLVAVVTGDSSLKEIAILKNLRERLPAYMVPTSVKVISEIPLTSNQKIDQSAVLAILGKRGA